MENKWLKRAAALLASGCLIFSLAGCSKGQELVDKAVQKINPKAQQEETQTEEVEEEPEVDVAKPELTTNLEGSVTYTVGDKAEALKVEAKTSDSGTITYQWDQSTTNKNGGGSIIEGATESTYTPSTKEAGILYYYVVATNNIGSSSNGVTSETVEVVVNEEGEEAQEGAEGQEQPQETEGQEQPETAEGGQEAAQGEAQPANQGAAQ